MMSMCAIQSFISGHNFGGCLATTANKGGIDSSRYTRFKRTCPRWCSTPNAGAASYIAAGAADVFCFVTDAVGLPREGTRGTARTSVVPTPSRHAVHCRGRKKSGLWNHAWQLPAATRLVLFDKKAAKYLMQAVLNKHRAVP